MSAVAPPLDLSRRVVGDVARVYVEHAGPSLAALVLHGSALTGDVIPGCSDIDLLLYLDEDAFDGRQLPLEMCAGVQRDLAKIDLGPFRSVQCFPYGSQPQDGAGPIPGAYRVLAGERPLPEASAADLRDRARETLDAIIPRAPDNLLNHGGGLLERAVRQMCSWVWTIAYKVLLLDREDALDVWTMPKLEAARLLPRNTGMPREAAAFHQAVAGYYRRRSVDGALETIRHGVAFFRSAKAWWEGVPEPPPAPAPRPRPASRIPALDVSALAVEARPVAAEAGAVYVRHAGAWFVGLVAYGSALNGGFVKGLSDIDLRLVLADEAFSEEGLLPLEFCLAVHRDLAAVDTAPFRNVQCIAVPAGSGARIRSPYHVVAGRSPLLDETAAASEQAARSWLDGLGPVYPSALLSSGGGELEHAVDELAGWVWRTLYQILTLEVDPLEVWRLPRDRAVELVPADTPLGRDLCAFQNSARAYYAGRDVDGALAAYEDGSAFLRTAKSWWEAASC